MSTNCGHQCGADKSIIDRILKLSNLIYFISDLVAVCGKFNCGQHKIESLMENECPAQ